MINNVWPDEKRMMGTMFPWCRTTHVELIEQNNKKQTTPRCLKLIPGEWTNEEEPHHATIPIPNSPRPPHNLKAQSRCRYTKTKMQEPRAKSQEYKVKSSGRRKRKISCGGERTYDRLLPVASIVYATHVLDLLLVFADARVTPSLSAQTTTRCISSLSIVLIETMLGVCVLS